MGDQVLTQKYPKMGYHMVPQNQMVSYQTELRGFFREVNKLTRNYLLHLYIYTYMYVYIFTHVGVSKSCFAIMWVVEQLTSKVTP